MKNSTLEGLEPAILWKHFEALCRIPRCSGNEEAACAYVIGVAREKGLPWQQDVAGNVLVRKPPAEGREAVPAVVVQNHLDMVCVKTRDSGHNFSSDPIALVREGDWVRAHGTSLGADNGVGAAAALALLDADHLIHGALELLFTVDEETGLCGARQLDAGMLSGRLMINLDSEEEGTLYIGCAGGIDTDIFLDLATEPAPEGGVACRLRVGGLTGGHSGTNIHEGRANAIKLLARVLDELKDGSGLRLASLTGGEMRNAIPRGCEAHFSLPRTNRPLLERAVQDLEQRLCEECSASDPGVFLEFESPVPDVAESVLTREDQDRLLRLLLDLPNGVVARVPEMPDAVETSTNVGTVNCCNAVAEIVTLQRSSSDPAMEKLAGEIAAMARKAGARVAQGGRYPGWMPNPASPLLQTARQVLRSSLGKDPEVKAIHAGLECGIIGAKVPGIDMISFGPDIVNPHSPQEAVDAASVQRMWEFLIDLLEKLADH